MSKRRKHCRNVPSARNVAGSIRKAPEPARSALTSSPIQGLSHLSRKAEILGWYRTGSRSDLVVRGKSLTRQPGRCRSLSVLNSRLPTRRFYFHRKIQLAEFQLVKRRKAAIARRFAQLFLDAQQLVVFRDAVRTRGRAGLDLAAVGGDS